MEPDNAENEPPSDQFKNETSNGPNMESSDKLFLVKKVSEINADSLNDTDENSNKRKFSAPIEEADNDDGNPKAKKANNDNICVPTSVKIETNDSGQFNESNADKQVTNIESATAIQIKTEPSSSESVDETISTIQEKAAKTIKVEPHDNVEANADIHTENSNDEPSCSTGIGIGPNSGSNVKVEKALASSTTRESCRFGIRCFRLNFSHRQEEAHPGDADYRRPEFPEPPSGTPACPYGQHCYRRNPTHFEQFSHPPGNLYMPNIPQNLANFERNVENRLYLLRQAEVNATNEETSDFEDDFDDPFYVPTDDDDDSYSDDSAADYDSYTDDLSVDYDDCDRVEE